MENKPRQNLTVSCNSLESVSEIVEPEPDFCPITGTTKRQRDAIGRMIWPVPIQLQPPNGCHRFLTEWDEM